MHVFLTIVIYLGKMLWKCFLYTVCTSIGTGRLVIVNKLVDPSIVCLFAVL